MFSLNLKNIINNAMDAATRCEPSVSSDLIRKQFARAGDAVTIKLLEHAKIKYGLNSFERAWHEWCCFEERPFSAGSPDFVIFMSWYLTRWRKSLGLELLRDQSVGLTHFEIAYLSEALVQPFTFLEILKINTQEGIQVRDLLSERLLWLNEEDDDFAPGEIVFGRILQFRGMVLFESVSQFVFPGEFRESVLSMKRGIERLFSLSPDCSPTPKQVRACDSMVRALYQALSESDGRNV